MPNRIRISPLALALFAVAATVTGCHSTPPPTPTATTPAPATAAAPVAPVINAAEDRTALSAAVQHLVSSVMARDFNGIMSYYVPNDSLHVYDVVLPREYVGPVAYRKDWEATLAPYVGPVSASLADWTIYNEGALAFAHGTFTLSGTGKDGKPLSATLRVTDVYRKLNGKWLVVHEHVSAPVDPATGIADMTSKR